jgi:DNA-binding transcriptional LysR family regulator
MLHITLKDIETFKAIATLDSVTLAAQTVGLTQSAASQSLSKLEHTLGVDLFDRVGKRLYLNECGRLLLSKSHILLDHAQQIQSLFNQNHYHLHLGASTTIANYILPEQLAQFRKAQPSAQVQMLVGNTQDIVEAVASLRVDIGLIEGSCHHPDIVLEPWLDDELVVFTHPDHPLAHQTMSKTQLAREDWVLRESGSGTREETDRWLRPLLPHLNVAMELGHSEAIKNAVAAGLGVSCLSRHVIHKELALGLLVPIKTKLPNLRRQLYKIRHRDKTLSQGIRAFFAFKKTAS